MTFSITVLGSSSALPTSNRFPSAHVLNVHERLFLFDCAEGTQIQLRKYKQKLSRLNHIFITHLHGDHVLGLIGLIATLNLLDRKHELNIFAHAPLEPILWQNINFFVNDLKYPIRFWTLDSKRRKTILEHDGYSVESFPLKHRIHSNGFIFRESDKQPNIKKEFVEKFSIPLAEIVRIKQGANFTTPEGIVIPNEELTYISSRPRSFAFLGDTVYLEKVAEIVRGVDLLYHEATFSSEHAKTAKQTGHSTAAQAAKIALQAGVDKLIIGHFSSRYKDVTPLLEEARQVFPETYLAHDGLQIEVPEKKIKPH